MNLIKTLYVQQALLKIFIKMVVWVACLLFRIRKYERHSKIFPKEKDISKAVITMPKGRKQKNNSEKDISDIL